MSTSRPADPIKVYDARWVDGEFSDAEVVRLFDATLRYAREQGADTVVVTRDARLAGPRVMQLAIDEALRQGFRVRACADPVSTPHHYFLCLETASAHPGVAGLAITASHNPGEYIGLKATLPVARAIGLDCGPDGGLTRVRALYHDGGAGHGRPGGRLELVDLRDAYVGASLAAAEVAEGSLGGLRVAVDALHGSAGPEFYRGLTRAGAEVIPLRLLPDGRFPAGSPNPTSRGKLDELAAVCRNHNADLFIGIDGDGDRLVFGSGRGVLSAGFASIPMLRAWARRRGKTGMPVLYDPKVSPPALRVWADLGIRPVLFRNGHSQIKDYMDAIGAEAGVEESGHYYHRLTVGNHTVATENSLLTALLLLREVREDRGEIARLHDLEQNVFTTGEINVQFADDATRDRALAAALARLVSLGAAVRDRTDDGQDLGGTAVAIRVTETPDGLDVADDWVSGFLRVATNEKAVLRTYLSADRAATGQALEREVLGNLTGEFGGRVVD